jgi:hypothetical protein
MLLVLPVSQVDLKLATKLAGHMALLGNLGRHKLLVVGAYNTKDEAAALKEQLAPLFASAELFVPDSECELGWPQSANHLWARTVRHLQHSGNKDTWYWFEADNTPIREDWLDAIETEQPSPKTFPWSHPSDPDARPQVGRIRQSRRRACYRDVRLSG